MLWLGSSSSPPAPPSALPGFLCTVSPGRQGYGHSTGIRMVGCGTEPAMTYSLSRGSRSKR
eukprot:9660861-Alexandrium_andersonii.AAC.1